MIKGNCLYCDKEFTGTQSKKKYCSGSCKTMFLRKTNNPQQHLNKTCLKCSKPYRGTHSSKYCSEECKLVQKNCLYCNEGFQGHPNSKFCSSACKDSYKVRKSTGEFKRCLVCNEKYDVTYGKKKTKKQVCSVKCANVLASSKSGEYITIEQIEGIIKNLSEQPSASIVANLLNTSHTTIIARAKEHYGSFREMIVSLRGTYLVLEDDKSYTANVLFSLIDNLYSVIGIREKTFEDLINPLTKAQLRIDYFLPQVPLAIEYHGIQHYKEVEFFDTTKSNTLKDRQIRDKIKEDYLNKNNIPLVIFDYEDEINENIIKSKLDIYLK